MGWLPMKLIVAGSRSINDWGLVFRELDRYTVNKDVDMIVSGGAKGVDRAAILWANTHGIPFKIYLPNYNMYGKIAPLTRNEKMASYGNELLCIWDGKSRGSIHMVECMRRIDKPFTLIDIRGISRQCKDKEPQEGVTKDMAEPGVEKGGEGVC
jgi:hypothetical protein